MMSRRKPRFYATFLKGYRGGGLSEKEITCYNV